MWWAVLQFCSVFPRPGKEGEHPCTHNWAVYFLPPSSLLLPHLLSLPPHFPFPPPLQDASVHRSVKPCILSTIGDIALAIGAEFKNYLDIVFHILQQAAQTQVDKVSKD